MIFRCYMAIMDNSVERSISEDSNPWDTPPIGEMIVAILFMALFLPIVLSANLLRAIYRCVTSRM